MTSTPRPHRPGPRREPTRRTGDDAGGVWIATGIVLGILMYGFIVLMDVAGFTAVAPLVVVPPVVLGLIAANSLLNGGRGHGRPARTAPAPLSSDELDGPPGPAGPGESDRIGSNDGHPTGESRPPR